MGIDGAKSPAMNKTMVQYFISYPSSGKMGQGYGSELNPSGQIQGYIQTYEYSTPINTRDFNNFFN